MIRGGTRRGKGFQVRCGRGGSIRIPAAAGSPRSLAAVMNFRVSTEESRRSAATAAHDPRRDAARGGISGALRKIDLCLYIQDDGVKRYHSVTPGPVSHKCDTGPYKTHNLLPAGFPRTMNGMIAGTV